MISKEELYALKEERRILIASRDEAKQDYIEAKKAFDAAKKSKKKQLLNQVRITHDIWDWFDFQVDEISEQIRNNYIEVWNTKKPLARPDGKAGKKKGRRGRRIEKR